MDDNNHPPLEAMQALRDIDHLNLDESNSC